jgi:hypothetical protein
MNAGDADVRQQFHRTSQGLGGIDRFMSHRQVAGAGRDNDDPADRRPLWSGRQPKRPARTILLRLGKALGEVSGLLGVNAGSQAILAGLGQFNYHLLDPGTCLAFTKDYLGRATALPPVQIHVGKSQIGHSGPAQLLKRFLNAELAGANGFEQLA